MPKLIDEILKKMEISKIEGLSFEIKDCLESNPKVKSINFVKNNVNMYYIKAYVDNLNVNSVHDIFKRFANFIEYNCFSMYERHIDEKVIEYNLVSSIDKVKCFHCKVEFHKA